MIQNLAWVHVLVYTARKVAFESRSFATKLNHVVVRNENLLSHEIIRSSDLNEYQVKSLLDIGAVYVKLFDSVETSKPQRVFCDHLLRKGDYIRYHNNPRRYPTNNINWASRILLDRPDYIIIDKPSGIPANPTCDNFYENAIESVRGHLNISDLFLAHRLDVDTTGILMLGKRKASIPVINDIFRNRKIRKIYKLIIVSSTLADDKILQSLQPGQLLRHYMAPSSTSPRYFTAEPRDGYAECLSRLVSISRVARHTIIEWKSWANCLKSNHDSSSRNNFIVGFNSWLAGMTHDSAAFCEIQLELLTGRTHQCRGQMSALGPSLHIAGDAMYNGIMEIPSQKSNNLLDEDDDSDSQDTGSTLPSSYESSPQLALQACKLSFIDCFRDAALVEDLSRLELALSQDQPRQVLRSIRQRIRNRVVQLPSSETYNNWSLEDCVIVEINHSWWEPLSCHLSESMS